MHRGLTPSRLLCGSRAPWLTSLQLGYSGHGRTWLILPRLEDVLLVSVCLPVSCNRARAGFSVDLSPAQLAKRLGASLLAEPRECPVRAATSSAGAGGPSPSPAWAAQQVLVAKVFKKLGV